MDIKISKSARVCRGCERDFVHEEPVTSLVRVQEKELLREDFCAACWRNDRAADAFSHWNTKYYDPRVAEQEPEEAFSPLRQLFYEALESDDRIQQAKVFLAAQLLRRQKVFRQIKESDEADGETKIVLFNDRIGNRLIEVRDPNFTYSELEQGRILLMQRLQELEAPPAAEPAEASAASEADASAPADENADEPAAEPNEDAEEDDDDDDEDEYADSGDDDGDDEDDEDDDEEYDDDDDDDDDDEEYDDDEFEDDDEDDEDEDGDDDDLEEEDLAAEEELAEEESKAHVQ